MYATTIRYPLGICLMMAAIFPATRAFVLPARTAGIGGYITSWPSPSYPLRSKVSNKYRHEDSSEPTDSSPLETQNENFGFVIILERGPNHIVALKPPSVVCHHSGWTGSRSKAKRGEVPEIPMLQRVRDAMHDIDSSKGLIRNSPQYMRKVNLVHRLDRGASGALLFAFANDDVGGDDDENEDSSGIKKEATSILIDAMASPEATKTYVALVRGEGILGGEDLKQKGWFEVSRPIKDEDGVEKDATTLFYFVAGQPETNENGIDRPRMSLVLARPKQGRWHQIRRHLNGLSHPILGDSTHGASKVNREWKEKRNLPGERLCLHMARLQLPSNEAVPQGIDVSCPLLEDMLNMLHVYAPDVLEAARPILQREGIIVVPATDYEVGRYNIPQEYDLKEESSNDLDVEILDQGEHFVVANKPPSVVVHHSSWTNNRSDQQNSGRRIEPTPLLQRVRDKIGKKVNPVHRLDRGASGCLVFSITKDRNENEGDIKSCPVTKTLMEAMQNEEATKTYIALCDGDGTWNGVNYLEKGWFNIRLPVKDEWGNLIHDCSTDIRFVASETLAPTDQNGIENVEGRRVALVLARPRSGKWHQIRQHLASGTIGHAILGDSSHGRSRTNRIWKKHRKLIKERTCLHLAHVHLPPTEYTPEGINVSCPLPDDLKQMLKETPGLVEKSMPILQGEGVEISIN